MSGGIPGKTQRTFRASGSIWSLIGPAAVFVLMMGFAASAGAVVFCVSPSGSVPSATSKALGCGPTVTKTISAAVGFASGTDSIVVLRGIYAEMVTIPASLSGLTLSAASTVQPTIDANGLQNGILEQANGVTIKGFAIKNAEHEGILVQGPPANCTGSPTTCTAGSGITGVAISNNLIENNDKAFVSSSTTCPAVGSVPAAPDFEQEDCGEGIHLDGVTDSTVANNLVQHNAGGILLTDETGQNRSNVITANL